MNKMIYNTKFAIYSRMSKYYRQKGNSTQSRYYAHLAVSQLTKLVSVSNK